MNSKEWKVLNEKAKHQSADEFTTEASKISKLTEEQIKSVIEDANIKKEKLSELMSVIGDAAKNNEQKADAIRAGTGLAETAVSLLGKLL